MSVALVLTGCGSKPTLEEARYMPRFGQPQSAATRPTTVPAYRYTARLESDAGWSYLRQGRPDDAMDDFNAAWTIDPAAAETLWGMADVQMTRAARLAGQPDRRGLEFVDQACGLFDDARRQGSADPQLKVDAALALATRGDYRTALKEKGADADYADAERLLDDAAAAGPSSNLFLTLMRLARHRGDTAAAADAQRRAATQPAGPVGPPPSTEPAPVVTPAPAEPKTHPKARPASRPTSRPTSRPASRPTSRPASRPTSRPRHHPASQPAA